VVPKINVPVKSVNNDIICTNNKCTSKLEPKSIMKALFVYKNIHLIGKSIKFRQETHADKLILFVGLTLIRKRITI